MRSVGADVAMPLKAFFRGCKPFLSSFLRGGLKPPPPTNLWLEWGRGGSQDVAAVFFLDERDYPEAGALPGGVQL
jgi:hypothetical protein